jgi:hypothetical protein
MKTVIKSWGGGEDEDKKEKRKRIKVKGIIKQNCCCFEPLLHLIT